MSEQASMLVLPDKFMLTGHQQLASHYGYSIAALDINNDGHDDLLVGAPFHYETTSKELEVFT